MPLPTTMTSYSSSVSAAVVGGGGAEEEVGAGAASSPPEEGEARGTRRRNRRRGAIGDATTDEERRVAGRDRDAPNAVRGAAEEDCSRGASSAPRGRRAPPPRSRPASCRAASEVSRRPVGGWTDGGSPPSARLPLSARRVLRASANVRAPTARVLDRVSVRDAVSGSPSRARVRGGSGGARQGVRCRTDTQRSVLGQHRISRRPRRGQSRARTGIPNGRGQTVERGFRRFRPS